MSHNLPQISLSANYQVIFDNALEAYKEKTGKDLPSDPLLRKLESCNSPDTVLDVLRDQTSIFNQPGGSLTRFVKPTINVLYTFSSTVSDAVNLAYPPAGVVFTAIGSLLLAAQDVSAGQDALLEIFERIENAFKRLETYTELPPTKEMTDIIIKVMVEVLLILALMTKEFEHGKLKKFLKKAAGRSEINDALRRLDNLTQEEHRITTAQNLRATHSVRDEAGHIKDELGKVVPHVDDQKWQKLHSDLETWLSPPDPFINYNTASDARHGGTGVWFIESTEFKDWKESTSLLWVYGKPGAGKSIITSAIIEEIKHISNTGPAYMAFFFFDFKDTRKQDARALLSSVVVQLSWRSQSFYDILFDFYSVHERGSQQPSIRMLTKCLEDMIKTLGDIPIYLVLDALDECPDTKGIPSPRRQVIDLVGKLIKQGSPRLHICITSRPEVDIRTSLEPLTSTSGRICLHDQVGQKRDIVEFIRGIVYSDENMRRWQDGDKQLVIETLSGRANGMFRWVYCQLEVLRQCFPSSVRGVLAELPESLDETYERILQQIPKPNQVHANRLLKCLVVTARPLEVEELAEVLTIDFSSAGMTLMMDESLRWEDKERAVLTACSSLITIVRDWDRRLVQFSHFSVKEFLTSDRLAASAVDTLRYHHIGLEAAHIVMARACLSVLFKLEGHMDKQTIRSYPLSKYAGKHFGNHVEFENVISCIGDGLDKLLDKDKPHFYTWVWLQIGEWNPKDWHSPNIKRNMVDYPYSPITHYLGSDTKPKYPPRLPPLYYVSALGPLCLARHLILTSLQDLDVRDDEGCTPLHIAVLAENEEVLHLLIQHCVDSGIQDINHRTPLHMMVYMGLAKAARMVLDRVEPLKARLNAKDKKGRTPLHLASWRCHFGIARLLLKFGADVDAQDTDTMTPLHLVSQTRPLMFGDGSKVVKTVQVLLEHGASVHAWDKNGRMPLHVALEHGLSDIVAPLLKYGADVDAQDNDAMTPLHWVLQSELPTFSGDESRITETVRHGLSGIVESSLRFDVDLDTQDNDVMDSLLPPPPSRDDFRFTEVAKMLLEHGASVHMRNKNGQTPLHLASHRGLSYIVTLLLKLGADVDAQDNNAMTPLHLVSQSRLGGNFRTAELLLEHGASVHMRNKNGQMPLHLASHRGLSYIVALLLKPGADVDAQDNNAMTPLLLVSQSRLGSNSQINKTAKVLLEHGASVHMRNKNGQMPLHLASQQGRFAIVESLLKLGADVDACDNSNITPLHLVVSSPFQRGFPSDDYYDSLMLGSVMRTTNILLEHGGNLQIQNDKGQTPFQLALTGGEQEIIDVLSGYVKNDQPV